MKSNYASVTEQAGIYAGDGGYDIRAEDDTHLKGAVIASTAKAEKNRLTTGTLTMEDIENKADYDVKGIGVSYNHFSTEEAKNDNYNETGFIPSLMPGAEKKTGTTTRAAISEGTVITTKEELDIEKINRDTADSLHALEKIFDKDKIEERQELAKLFAKNADELLHKYDRDGTFDKALAHGIVAEITSQIAGNEAGAGFAAGFTNELLIKKIDEWAKGDPSTAQWISAALGATVNSVIGENGDTGAAVAQYATKWNAYREKPLFDGAFYSTTDGAIYIRKNGQDIYVESVPDNAYVWVQDENNPSAGWEYFKGKADDGGDLYLDNEYVTSVYYFSYEGSVYGMAFTEYTKGYRTARVRELGKLYAEAAILGQSTVRTIDLMRAGATEIEDPNSDNLGEFINAILDKAFKKDWTEYII